MIANGMPPKKNGESSWKNLSTGLSIIMNMALNGHKKEQDHLPTISHRCIFMVWYKRTILTRNV